VLQQQWLLQQLYKQPGGCFAGRGPEGGFSLFVGCCGAYSKQADVMKHFLTMFYYV
jgi:hypothetical protein